jgi:hypothetical protein
MDLGEIGWGGGLDSVGSGYWPLVCCWWCTDEPLGSGTTWLVSYGFTSHFIQMLYTRSSQIAGCKGPVDVFYVSNVFSFVVLGNTLLMMWVCDGRLYCCEQLFNLMKNLISRTTTRLTDEHAYELLWQIKTCYWKINHAKTVSNYCPNNWFCWRNYCIIY